jgi:hypothetical protein
MTTTPEYELTVDRDGARLEWQGQTFEIEADDLIEGGWTLEACDADHCKDGDCPECPEFHYDPDDPTNDLNLTVRRWHDDEHPSPWAFCAHPICYVMREGETRLAG